MRTVAIVGVGLLGGSFGLALKKAGFDGRVTGVSSPGALKDALDHGAIDGGLPLEEALPEADLVFLAQPIRRIIDTLGRIDPLVKPGALVTDAGSTKCAIVQAGRAVTRAQFLGGHPMAGKETRGAAAADADLFRGRTWVLTPASPEQLETPAAVEFQSWIERIGARPLVLQPQEHDRTVALTSHLPQLLSTALAAAAGEHLKAGEDRCAGPALRDLTRLALSPYEIWADIFATNTEAVTAALDKCIERLERYREALTSSTMEKEFDAARDFASRLRSNRT